MRVIRRVYGPYTNKKTGRRHVRLAYEDGTYRCTTYARHLMEEHLGHEIAPGLEVDHIDNDRTNDTLDNLQVLTKRENIQKMPRPKTYITFTCPMCGAEGKKRAGVVRGNKKCGHAGPFCSKPCALKYTAALNPPTMVTIRCPTCASEVERKASIVRANRKKGWGGPYCSRSCAAKAPRQQATPV